MRRRRLPRERTTAAPGLMLDARQRARLVSASGWLAAALGVLLAFAAASVFSVFSLGYSLSTSGSRLAGALWYAIAWGCAGTHATFCLAAYRGAEALVRVAAIAGVLSAAVFSLALFGTLVGDSPYPWIVAAGALSAALLAGLTDLVLARLLRRSDARTSGWVATVLGLGWFVALAYVSVGPENAELTGLGFAWGALLLVLHCSLGALLLLMFRGQLRAGASVIDASSDLAPVGRAQAVVLVSLAIAVLLTFAPVALLAGVHVERCTARLAERAAPAGWEAWAPAGRLEEDSLGPYKVLYDEGAWSLGRPWPKRLHEPRHCKGSTVELREPPEGWPPHSTLVLLEQGGDHVVIAQSTSVEPRVEELVVAFRTERDGALRFDAEWVADALQFALLLLWMPFAGVSVCALAELRAAWRVFRRRGVLTHADGELLENGLVQLADGSASLRWRGAHLRPGPVLVAPELVTLHHAGASGTPFREVPGASRGVIAASRDEMRSRGVQALVRARRLARAALALGLFTVLVCVPLLAW